jgi:maltose alpha-D-glucosyltransferase/alpha-amylase
MALQIADSCTQLFQERHREALTPLLATYLKGRRWFGGKARTVRSTTIPEVISFPFGSTVAYLTSLAVGYLDGDPETYVLPLGIATGEEATRVQQDYPQAVVTRLKGTDGEGVLYEVVWENDFCQALLDAIARRRRFKGALGELVGAPTRALRSLCGPGDVTLPASLAGAEQSNTSIIYGEKLILKLFRRLDEGVNPDLEISRFLSERAAFPHTAPVAGALEYRRRQGETMTVAILHSYAKNQGDAWRYTLDFLGRYCESALTRPSNTQPAVPLKPVLALTEDEVPPLVSEMAGSYLASARLLGQRTAEMHIALASEPDDPAFAPEPFSTLYQRSLYQSMRSLTIQSFQLLRQRLKHLSEAALTEARHVLDRESEVFHRFQSILHHKLTAMRTRYHGDFHLGQVLYTGKDFVIIDFEGEPARPLSERRMKRSPLRDAAGMLRSFHYAADTALFDQVNRGTINSHPGGIAALAPWVQLWRVWASAAFLGAYLDKAGHETFIPRNRADLQILLDVFCLEKAVYELSYELNNRPTWALVPLRGILQFLEIKN